MKKTNFIATSEKLSMDCKSVISGFPNMEIAVQVSNSKPTNITLKAIKLLAGCCIHLKKTDDLKAIQSQYSRLFA